jgi:hypothetical protein
VHGVEREHRLVVVVVHDRRAEVDALQGDLGDLLGARGTWRLRERGVGPFSASSMITGDVTGH